MIAYNLQNLYEKCSADVDEARPSAVEAKHVRKCHSVRDIDTVITAQARYLDFRYLDFAPLCSFDLVCCFGFTCCVLILHTVLSAAL
jgi:hypothetical protein